MQVLHTHALLVPGLALLLTACSGEVSVIDGAPRTGGLRAQAGAGGTSGAGAGTGGAGAGGTTVDDCLGAELTLGTTPLQRLTREQYARSVRDLLALPALPDVTGLAQDEKIGPFSGNNVAPVSGLVIDAYMRSAESLVAQASLTELVVCDTAALGEASCIDAFIATFGERVYRRPLSAEEESAYQTLRSEYLSLGYAQALRVIAQTMLQSPNFLYHVELEPTDPADAQVVPLDAYELAARLSYFLIGSTPDADLLEAARSGAVLTPMGLRAQAERLIADDRSADAIASFHLEWLELDQLEGMQKDQSVYPSFDAELAAAMRREVARFSDYVVRNDDGTLETLLTAPFSLLEEPLLALYGVNAGADTSQPIALDATQRSGLLTQAGFLAAHSHGNQSSPVQRGKTVIENVLCEDLPDPPPNVDTSVPEPSPDLTTRERLAEHRESDSCAGCHTRIDGIGLGFEQYDGIGAFRTMEGNRAADGSGEIAVGKAIDGPFNGAVELSRKLAQSSDVQECVSRQWLRFALGRMESAADRCSLNDLYADFHASGHDIRALLIAIVDSDAFRMRGVAQEGP